MFKTTVKLMMFVCSFALFAAKASPIYTDLDENDYITYGGLDWAWASSVNVQYYVVDFDGSYNELYAPTIFPEWRFATDDEISVLLTEITSDGFRRDDGSYIVATKYFNSLFTDYQVTDFDLGDVSGSWQDGSTLDFFGSAHWPSNYWFDTFYVRTSLDSEIKVPEPTALAIFALALLMLTLQRKKAQNKG